MTTEELIKEIKTAFENVTLQDGIGLWEAQGLDSYADNATLLKLKKTRRTRGLERTFLRRFGRM